MNHNQFLDYNSAYPCPVCRHGEISSLALMEAYACNFCQHIFTANLEKQVLKMADSQIALTWFWNGQNWKGVNREGVDMGWRYGIAAGLFVILPTSIVSTAAYLFPAMPGSNLSWLPIFWSFFTFFAHLSFLFWLVIEYYQFPVNLYLNSLARRLLRLFQRGGSGI
ncbi:MAG: hypothetical protein N5P05_000749 [Chroococcopsis gigantea SAG 12.99]|nr:hypothetical protein [Chlorogloea purpurea SAG 13.99]MDV2999143.1 hypothetical protein [Chroococcopsis gigantea SAG 12.99]